MGGKPHSASQEGAISHPGLRESFATIASLAREALRERGLAEPQIEVELTRAKRDSLEN